MESDLREYFEGWFKLVTGEGFIIENADILYTFKKLGYLTSVKSAMVGFLYGVALTHWTDLLIEENREIDTEREEEFNSMLSEYIEKVIVIIDRTL